MKERDEKRNEYFYDCILQLKTKEECSNFFSDICTRQELNALCQRLEVARLLWLGRTYSTIAEETGASTATISRVNRSLVYGEGGYTPVLERTIGKQKEKSQNE